MHKWNMFKRTAPIVLSLVVAATSAPSTVLAVDAFEDGTAVEIVTEDTAATPEEMAEEAEGIEAEEIFDAEAEEVQGEVEEVVGEPDEETAEADLAEAEDTTVTTEDTTVTTEETTVTTTEPSTETTTEAASDVSDGVTEVTAQVTVAGVVYDYVTAETDGYTQIGETGVYYKVAEGSTAPAADAYYYGTATLTYTEFYQGDVEGKTEYDAVASATPRKYEMFENEDTTVNYGDDGTTITKDADGYCYYINGVKNVSVRVAAQTYAEAEILKAADKLPESGVYTEADGIALAEDQTAEVKQYKTLNEDGTYSATTFNVAATVTDAAASLNTSSNWGDYEIDITETTTKILRNQGDEYEVGSNLMGVIIETVSGKKIGLRHMEETWVKTYEFSFDVDYCDLQGETVNKVTYITADSAYVFDFGDNGVYIKPQASDELKSAVTAAINSKIQVEMSGISDDFTDPQVQVSWLAGRRKTSYLVAKTAVTPTDGKVTLTFDNDQIAVAEKEYTVTLSSTNYADISVTAKRTAAEGYTYLYAGLTWAEYWASEGVSNATDTSSSEEVDAKGEYDLGGFDAVTRATTNHGLHRGSYQMLTTIYDTDGNTYQLQTWDGRNTMVLTDGTTVSFDKGTITTTDGATHTMDHYTVTGIKYVPVKVAAEDLEAFKAAYPTTENDGAMSGGYGEGTLESYTATAAVDENTNGLKTATIAEDGTFSFSARTSGTTSGLKDTALATLTQEDLTVTVKDSDGSYGEFLRVDITGDNYHKLGEKMQAVRWDYYGSGDTVLASYGTKFAADNWMHKSNGVQLGLTKSVRCQLPDGTDGTGKWVVTIYALGYADTVLTIEATEENIVGLMAEATEQEISDAQALYDEAAKLVESDYTADSWSSFAAELSELKDELKKSTPKSSLIATAVEHLNAAIAALVKVETTTTTETPTTTTTEAATTTTTEAPTTTTTEAATTTATEAATTTTTEAATTITTETPATETTGNADVETPSLTVKKSVVNLKAKKTTTIKPVLTGISGKVTYKSSNKKVAAVNSKGKITAKKTGKAVITVKCGSYKTKVTVYVNEKLTLKKSSATIKVKGKVKIKASTNIKGTITYKSSNKKVATVTRKGVVKGVKKGTATITVKCNGKTKKFKVTVK